MSQGFGKFGVPAPAGSVTSPRQSQGVKGAPGLGLVRGLTAGLPGEGSKPCCLELKGPWGWETDKKPSPGLRGWWIWGGVWATGTLPKRQTLFSCQGPESNSAPGRGGKETQERGTNTASPLGSVCRQPARQRGGAPAGSDG